MIDQVHLRNLLARHKDAAQVLGIDVDKVHWQSYAVMLAHMNDPSKLGLRLVEDGWFKDGRCRMYRHRPSLWLSPKAMPYFVRYECHSEFVDMTGMSRPLMEAAGWLHISDGRVDVEAPMTARQTRWIEDNGGWNTSGGPFRLNDNYHGEVQAYPDGSQFDIMPTEDEDRLLMRVCRVSDPVGQAIQPCVMN